MARMMVCKEFPTETNISQRGVASSNPALNVDICVTFYDLLIAILVYAYPPPPTSMHREHIRRNPNPLTWFDGYRTSARYYDVSYFDTCEASLGGIYWTRYVTYLPENCVCNSGTIFPRLGETGKVGIKRWEEEPHASNRKVTWPLGEPARQLEWHNVKFLSTSSLDSGGSLFKSSPHRSPLVFPSRKWNIIIKTSK
jgi:hypothetical protein